MALFRYSTLWVSALILLSVCLCDAIYTPYAKGVRLEDVQAITLHRGEKTTSRRSRAVPQLKCLAGPCGYEPETVQCVNVGSDGMDVQWRCEADLPQHVKFARTLVTCEGYEFPDDDRVLEGSCGLEYSLKEVGGGGSWFSGSRGGHSGGYYGAGDKRTAEPSRSSWQAGQWILLLLVMYIGYHLGRVYRQGTHRPQPQTSTDYRPSAPPPPSSGFFSRGMSGGPSYDGGNGKASSSSTARGSAWNGWTGAAAGYGLGYFMRGRRARQQQPSFWGRQSEPQGSWFSRGMDMRSRPNNGASGSRSNRQADPDVTEKATGYASTSRR